MADEVKMSVSYQNKEIPLFQNSDHKEAFRVTLYDFYRLTGQL
jgi:hypothetical protein